MIVADASLIIGGLRRAGPARRMLLETDVQVPHLVDAEVAQTLRNHVLRGWSAADVAEEKLARWQRLGVRRHSVSALLPRIWSLRETLSAYDATYVALAEALACPLATGDLRVVRAPGIACEIIRVTA
jgi:predicted nucleic acid-binding protein